MKILYLTESPSNIIVDKDNDIVSTLRCEDRYEIRNIFYVEEPMHVVYQSGERREEIDAKKGDVIIQFYNNERNVYILDVVRTKQWAANIKNARKVEQQEKEKWAARNADTETACYKECCECCADAEPEPPVEDVPKKATKLSKIKKLFKKTKKA